MVRDRASALSETKNLRASPSTAPHAVMTEELLRALAGDSWSECAWALDAALSAVDEHVQILDRDLRNVYVNRAGASAIGKGRSKVVGRTWRELGSRPAEVDKAFERLAEHVFQTGRRASETYSVLGPANRGLPRRSHPDLRRRRDGSSVRRRRRDGERARPVSHPGAIRDRAVDPTPARDRQPHGERPHEPGTRGAPEDLEAHGGDPSASASAWLHARLLFRYAQTTNWI